MAYVVQIRPDGRHIRQLQPEIVDVRDIMPNVAGKLRSGVSGVFLQKGNDRAPEEKKESDLADEQGDDEASFSEPGERGLAFPQYQQDKQRATQYGHPEEQERVHGGGFADKRGHARLVEPGEHAPHIGSGPVPDGLDDPDLPVGVEGLHLAVQRFELVFVLRDGRGLRCVGGPGGDAPPFSVQYGKAADARDFAKTAHALGHVLHAFGIFAETGQTREIEAELFAGNGLHRNKGSLIGFVQGSQREDAIQALRGEKRCQTADEQTPTG